MIIAGMLLAPLIVAFDDGSFGGYDASFDGGTSAGFDGSFDGSFGGAGADGFDGGSFAGYDVNGYDGGSYGGMDQGGFDGGSYGGGGSSFDGSGSFDTGPEPGTFPDPGFPGDLPGEPGDFPTEHDAVWQDLTDKTIFQGSPDGTMIQKNVFSKCTDPDSDQLVFQITSTSTHYELSFIGDDIRLFDLDYTFVGTETVTVTCNGVPESFLLHVITHGITPRTEPDTEDDRLSLFIGAIIIPNAYDAQAGDQVPVMISFKNNGDESLENLEAAVVIQDLGVRAAFGPLDLPVGRRVTRTVFIELPEDVKPGTYYTRIMLDSGALHRVKYRDVEVIA